MKHRTGKAIWYCWTGAVEASLQLVWRSGMTLQCQLSSIDVGSAFTANVFFLPAGVSDVRCCQEPTRPTPASLLPSGKGYSRLSTAIPCVTGSQVTALWNEDAAMPAGATALKRKGKSCRQMRTLPTPIKEKETHYLKEP
eukprot:1161833-Pelagomonas_calceolata.AAC.3